MFKEFIKNEPLVITERPSKKRVRAAKAEVFERIGRENAAAPSIRKLTKRAVLVPIAAAVAAIGTVTAGAAGVSGLVEKYFSNSAIADQLLQSDIFHDEDENVSIDVEEFISDGMVSYATVRYTALTDEGKTWLDKIPYKSGLLLGPRGAHNDPHDPQWEESPGILDYEKWLEYNYEGGYSVISDRLSVKDNEQRFTLIMHLNTKDAGGSEIDMFYPMTDGKRYTVINTENKADERIYTINAEDNGKYYIPTGVRVSQLSATVYGDFSSPDVYQGIGNPLNIGKEEYESLYMNTYLVKKDGTRLYLSGNHASNGLRGENDDFVLLSSAYRSYAGMGGIWFDERPILDPDDIVGIQIEDKYYSFTE